MRDGYIENVFVFEVFLVRYVLIVNDCFGLFGVESLFELLFGSEEKQFFMFFRVRICGRSECIGWIDYFMCYVVQSLLHNTGIFFVSGELVGRQIGVGELRIVVQYFFEVRN